MPNAQKIENFVKYKVLYELDKKRSPMVIKFLVEPKEDWLVDVIKYRRKSGQIIKHFIITQKQVEDWVDRFKRISGFKDITNEKSKPTKTPSRKRVN